VHTHTLYIIIHLGGIISVDASVEVLSIDMLLVKIVRIQEGGKSLHTEQDLQSG